MILKSAETMIITLAGSGHDFGIGGGNDCFVGDFLVGGGHDFGIGGGSNDGGRAWMFGRGMCRF